jgi:hypothetical protein
VVAAVHEELTRPRVMAVVDDLGAQGASGVLEVKGDPAGAIYLDGGQIAFAGASWAPGLLPRLAGLRPSPAGLQRLLAERDAEDAAVAAQAVQRGYLTAAGLHALIRSIVVDAFRREAARRADAIARSGLGPTTAVALRELRAPSAVLTREQWAVASQLTGNASARDLALRQGTALADMTECLCSLTRAGRCSPVRVRERRELTPAASRAALPAAALQAAALPSAGDGQPPSADILRQVLAGLRKLS